MKQLSKHMEMALKMAREAADESLHRWPGGFWTGDPWRGRDGPRVPQEHVGTNTVDALIERRLVEVSDRMKRGDPCRVHLI